ncbi:hypothetical protein [Delftia tsuruhatensis]|uniref:hypothetical protein n=1 Tax=Delftia tsuruhatensis TaxID=180282 RepID=UPI0030CEA0D0
MAIYLLDKNIVEDIKKSIKGLPTPGVALARSIDKKNNQALTLLAALEGSTQSAPSASELMDGLVSDSQAVGMFYKLAKTDSEYLLNTSASTAVTLSPHVREKTQELIPLTMELQSLLSRQFNWIDARVILKKIDEIALTNNFSLSHPLITCAVACLYQSRSARGVLKPAAHPNERDAYNAAADIRLIIETAYVKNMFIKNGERSYIKLLSGDKDLNELSQILSTTVSSTVISEEIDQEIISFNSAFSRKLLPSLNMQPKEMERILSYLKESRDGPESIISTSTA